MFSRRDLVVGGVAGAFASTAVRPVLAHDDEEGRQAMAILNGIRPSVDAIAGVVASNSLAQGYVPKLREAYTKYFKANNKWPDYCEVGMDVFYDIYDWHIKHGVPAQIGRLLENRLSIDFMYTHLVVRYDLDQNYIGLPFDRG